MNVGQWSSPVEIENSHSINKAGMGNTCRERELRCVDNERNNNARKDFRVVRIISAHLKKDETD